MRFRIFNDREQWIANAIIVKEEQLNSFIGTLVLKNAEAHATWLYSNIEDLDQVIEDLARRAKLDSYFAYEILESPQL